MERLLIVGNGMASVRLCQDLVQHCAGRFEITVVGAEPQPGYNRVLLSSLLAGESSLADISLKSAEWYTQNGIRLVTGVVVSSVDPVAKIALLDNNEALPFDRLVFATGSDPIRLAKHGMDLPGVITFRNLHDVEALRTLGQGKRAIVIGGGLLGLEAAFGLKRMGAEVSVIHLMDRLMERQLDEKAAAFLRKALEAKGIAFHLASDTDVVLGQSHVEGLRLASGAAIPADLVCVAVGIKPRTLLAGFAGCDVGRGIKVDDQLQTSLPGLYAIGECAEHRGIAYGLVEPAYQQAAVLAQYFSGQQARYEGSVLSTNLKVSGVSVFSAGDFLGKDDDKVVTYQDRIYGEYRKLVIRGDRLIGAVLVGDTGDALWYRDLILSGASIAAMRDTLIFGEAYCAKPGSAVPLAEAA
jgi:nitrite reductase (NADH) large subunit